MDPLLFSKPLRTLSRLPPLPGDALLVTLVFPRNLSGWTCDIVHHVTAFLVIAAVGGRVRATLDTGALFVELPPTFLSRSPWIMVPGNASN